MPESRCANMVDLVRGRQRPGTRPRTTAQFDVEIIYDEINETGIAGCREFDRRWVIQATDASGNTSSSDTTLQHITVLDTTAPDSVPRRCAC